MLDTYLKGINTIATDLTERDIRPDTQLPFARSTYLSLKGPVFISTLRLLTTSDFATAAERVAPVFAKRLLSECRDYLHDIHVWYAHQKYDAVSCSVGRIQLAIHYLARAISIAYLTCRMAGSSRCWIIDRTEADFDDNCCDFYGLVREYSYGLADTETGVRYEDSKGNLIIPNDIEMFMYQFSNVISGYVAFATEQPTCCYFGVISSDRPEKLRTSDETSRDVDMAVLNAGDGICFPYHGADREGGIM